MEDDWIEMWDSWFNGFSIPPYMVSPRDIKIFPISTGNEHKYRIFFEISGRRHCKGDGRTLDFFLDSWYTFLTPWESIFDLNLFSFVALVAGLVGMDSGEFEAWISTRGEIYFFSLQITKLTRHPTPFKLIAPQHNTKNRN